MTTIHDVAKLAGVSIKTVSRVVNCEAGVREPTRERVQQAIDKLQYTPHSGARLMRSSKSNLIGLITSAISTVSRDPSSAGLSSIHIVKGIQQVCREAGKTLLIIDTEPDESDVQANIDVLTSHRVEGIIHVLDYHRLIAPPAVQNTPCWLVNGYSGTRYPAVTPDDFAGQYLAVEYLITQGHRQLAYVGLPAELEAGRLRREGFLQAARDAGLPNDAVTTCYGLRLDGAQPVAVLRAELAQLFQAARPPTALCFGNDLMALHAMPILHEMGLNVPQDVSIMGFDNDMAIATGAARPELTTVSLPYQRMGQITARKLLEQLADPDSVNGNTYPIKIRGEVIPRQSVRRLQASSGRSG